MTTPVRLATHTGATVSCEGSNIRCPGATDSQSYTKRNPCTWTRKLCVTCRQDGSDVFIRVQGNGLPNHCINSTTNNAVANELGWEVIFQPDMTGIKNYESTDIDTDAKTDELLCDISRTKRRNMNAASKFINIDETSDTRRLQRDREGEGDRDTSSRDGTVEDRTRSGNDLN